MSSPLLDTPGAVAADPPDESVAAHYGDPLREQRAAVDRGGLVDRSNRGVVRISGEDRLSWLHNITTQHVGELQPGESVETLVLNPQGRVQHHLELVEDGEAVWAHVEPGRAPILAEFLESMQFLLRVEPADVTADYALLSVLEPSEEGGHEPSRQDEQAQQDSAASAAPSASGTAVAARRKAPHGYDVFAPRERLSEAVGELRASPPESDGGQPALVGLWGFEAFRIAEYRPRFGLDTDDKTLPNEMVWLDTAVHLDKGCYRGQETVAKIYNTGLPPRRLVFLHLDGSVDKLPAPGDPIEREDGKQAGFVGSAARHHELGPIALGMVKYKTPVDARLLIDGVAAAQESTMEIQDKPRVSRRL